MQMNPYLTFNGQCETAFKFYERVLGGKIEVMIPHAGTPVETHVPPEWRQKIMHARLSVNGQRLMGTDDPRYQAPKGFSVSLDVKDPAEAERVFQALSEKGKVNMPMQQTFWAQRFGMVTDQFGVPWMVNCENAE